MYKICVFAGTTEGRKIVEFLTGQPVRIVACVATEYGEAVLNPAENLRISAGRLSQTEMETLFEAERFDLVLDATHPYARAVSENLVEACSNSHTAYLRVLRENGTSPADAVYVESVAQAVEFLSGTDGNILLTTGSKELSLFSSVPDFANRVYARVLPMSESLALCEKAGVQKSHILAMQGPFSTEMNAALLHMTTSRWLVTKESGNPGGFDEKIAAAKQAGATPVVIGRPPQSEGKTVAQTMSFLCEKFGFFRKPQVKICGIGPGNPDFLTKEVKTAIQKADCLIGAARMLEGFEGKPLFYAVSPVEIAGIIRNHGEYLHFAVLMSGDTGFFSGTKKLLPMLSDCAVEVCPGISSMQYLCTKLGVSWETVKPVSLHGRERNLAADLRRNPRLFVLVGGENGAGALCRRICGCGYENAKISIGERLSYSDEKITIGTAKELAGRKFDSLSAVLVEQDAESIVTCGLPDEGFQRGNGANGVVPMTKREVRAVCLSRLELQSDSLCWDVGAGTGSVAVELALLADQGHVYAVERKPEAVELLEENKRNFHVENLSVVPGTAPECCRDLPKPSHVFIGGSSGNLPEILDCILAQNIDARIVATAVSLETVAQLNEQRSRFRYSDAVCLTVARERKVGTYHMMTGQNPIYIFTFQGGKSE